MAAAKPAGVPSAIIDKVKTRRICVQDKKDRAAYSVKIIIVCSNLQHVSAGSECWWWKQTQAAEFYNINLGDNLAVEVSFVCIKKRQIVRDTLPEGLCEV